MGSLRASIFVISAWVAAFHPISLRATEPSGDQTAALQEIIDALPPAGVLDCQGSSYLVTSLRLKSNMTVQNCNFQTSPGALDFAAPITIDGRSQPISNVVIRQVNVNGNRHGQTNIGYAGQENGGRHCFRVLGYVANLLIENSSGSYCASDGIAFVSYGVSSSDNPADLPFQHIVVRNSAFLFNRRQGGSGDGMNDVTFDNVTFSNNGTTVQGGLEGDQCDSSGGQCYGTGFWYEDYRSGIAGEGLNNILFSRCVFRNNFQRSMFFITHEQPTAAGYRPRGNIRIVNSYMDSGAQPLSEDYSLQFQVDPALDGLGAVFQNITVQNTSMDGSLGFHQVADVSVVSSVITTTLESLGYALNATNITFLDVQPAGKQLSAWLDPYGQGSPVVVYASTASSAAASARGSTRENRAACEIRGGAGRGIECKSAGDMAAAIPTAPALLHAPVAITH